MNTWPTKLLGDVIEKIETVDPKKSPKAKFRYVDVSSVSNESMSIHEASTRIGKDAPSRARRKIRTNDVLFATVRPTLKRIAIVPEELNGEVASTGYYVLRAKQELDPRYLFYYLQTCEFMDKMEKLQSGASYPAVNDGQVRSQEIPLPPLSEQRRIVSVLDAAFAGLATATANTQKNLQNARELFETHRTAVFSQTHKKWTTCPLREAVDEISTGPFGSLLHKSDYVKGGTPLVNPINIVDGEIEADTRKAIGDKKLKELSAYSLQTDDVVIGRRGEIGRCAVVTEQQDGWVCGTGCFFIRTGSNMNPYFLSHLLRSERYRSLLEGHSDRATMPSISNTQLANLPIHYPALDGQCSINKELQSYWEATVQLTDLAHNKLVALEELKQSLLHRAFRGELSGGAVATTASREVAWQNAGPFPFPVEGISTTDLHAGILAMAHESHESEGKLDRFGHVKAEKQAHMIEALFGIDLGRKPMKDAMGPSDFPHLQKVEHRARMAKFFNFKRDKDGVRYTITKLNSLDRIKQKATDALGERAADVQRLLAWMTPMTVEQAEIVATVFAGWNNLLLNGSNPTDEQIVTESRENWHPRKLEIDRDRFFKAIAWLRKEGVVPVGLGKRVEAKKGKKAKK